MAAEFAIRINIKGEIGKLNMMLYFTEILKPTAPLKHKFVMENVLLRSQVALHKLKILESTQVNLRVNFVR
jgi:hypothetical protein